MNDFYEPRITINGYTLTAAQAMTVRVALNAFSADLEKNGLGDDESGRRMTAAYLDRLEELFGLIYDKRANVDNASTEGSES